MASSSATHQKQEKNLPESCSIDRTIGARLSRKRADRGITSERFAESLGISEQALLAMEAGAERIDARLMRRICKALNVSVKYFFEPWTKRPR
jgi:transcriptional regulator with XRE-family HTH domain